jgi:hypothetical protein
MTQREKDLFNEKARALMNDPRRRLEKSESGSPRWEVVLPMEAVCDFIGEFTDAIKETENAPN